jgi:glycerol-3-phosphate dehydrogenase (NAD(P)+)
VNAPVRAAVLGAGSWGTAFSTVLCDAGTDVRLWARRSALAAQINEFHENPDYLPGVPLPDPLYATSDPAEALDGADFVVIAVPSQTCRENLAHWRSLLPDDAVLVSLMKGIELGTSKRMSEVIREVAGVPEDRVAVVSGPNLAKEIVHRQPTATVVACTDGAVARRLQQACNARYFRPYTNTDVVGCELGGAVKNVIALAVGMAAGMGFGDNTRAALITRGLAGLGDLVATCSSPLSRNRTFGENLGRGMTVEQVVQVTNQTAEGVKSCRSILDLARAHGVDMPITESVVSVVHECKTPEDMLRALLSRDPRPERRSR